MWIIPPVCKKMLKRWSRMTGQPGLTILKKQKENEMRDHVRSVINLLIMLPLQIEKPCLSSCYIIRLAFPLNVMEIQAGMSHRTTSHKTRLFDKSREEGEPSNQRHIASLR